MLNKQPLVLPLTQINSLTRKAVTVKVRTKQK